jgi:hypothetical protein
MFKTNQDMIDWLSKYLDGFKANPFPLAADKREMEKLKKEIADLIKAGPNERYRSPTSYLSVKKPRKPFIRVRPTTAQNASGILPIPTSLPTPTSTSAPASASAPTSILKPTQTSTPKKMKNPLSKLVTKRVGFQLPKINTQNLTIISPSNSPADLSPVSPISPKSTGSSSSTDSFSSSSTASSLQPSDIEPVSPTFSVGSIAESWITSPRAFVPVPKKTSGFNTSVVLCFKNAKVYDSDTESDVDM